MRRFHRFLTTPLLVLALAGLLTAAGTPPPDAGTIDRFIKQLEADNFKERKAATKALYDMGAPALAALRRVQATSKDADTQRRAIDLIHAIEARLTPDAFVPTQVWLKANKTPLGEVLRSLSKQSGISLYLAREPVDLARRPVTLDTGTISFWEALDALCRQTKIHLRPKAQAVSPTDRFVADTPSQSYLLVLQDGLLPETPVFYLGSVRLRLVLTARDQGEIRGYVEVLSEPRRAWSGELALRWSEAKDTQGNVLAVLPLTKESNYAPNSRRTVHHQEIPLLWPVAGKEVHAVAELRGEFLGKTKFPAEKVLTVDNLLTVAPQPLAGKGGYQLTVKDCQRHNHDGTVTLRLTVAAPAPKNVPAGQIIRRVVQIQGGVVQLAGANDDSGMLQFIAQDTHGRPYTIAVTQFEAETNNHSTTYQYKLRLQPAAKGAVPGKFELFAPLETTVKSSCTFRNFRLP